MGAECEYPAGSPEWETIGLGGGAFGTEPPPCTKEIIVFTEEKFRESGYYQRSALCPDKLDVTKAHARAAAEDNGVDYSDFSGKVFLKKVE